MRQERVIVVVIVASMFVVFAVFAPHTIFLGDNAEFITAAVTWGIPHPPGFPLFVLLGKIFSLLPFGSLVFRVNLVTVISSAVCLGFVFVILRRFIESRLVAILGTLLIGFSGIFWTQALTAKPFAFNTLVVVALLYLVLRFWETGSAKYLLASSLLAGLGLANHQLLLLLLPAYFFGFLAGPKVSHKYWAGSFALFLLGLSMFLLLPIRSMQSPALNWGETSASLEAFYRHITRLQYQDFGLASSWLDKGKLYAAFLVDWFRQFGSFVIFSFIGLAALIRLHRKLFFLGLGISLSNVLGIIFLRNVPFDFDVRYFQSGYYTPVYVITGIFAVIGLAAASKAVVKRWPSRDTRVKAVAITVLVLATTSVFLQNYLTHNLGRFQFIDDYTKGILESLDRDAVLLTSYEGISEDTLIFSLLYQQVVAGVRPDVTIVSYVDIFKTADRAEIDKIFSHPNLGERRALLLEYAFEKAEFSGRPIYTTYIADVLLSGSDYESLSNGYAFLTVKDSDPVTPFPAIDIETISPRDEAILLDDYAGRDVLAHYYLSTATALLRKGQLQESQALYIKVINNHSDPLGLDIPSYRAYREKFVK